MPDLGGAWAEILGWGFLLGGVVAFAGVFAVVERRRRRAHARGDAARLKPGREWDLVMQRASKELARGPRVEGLQSDAAVTVEAAEYAYKRLLLECARHGAAPSTLLAEPTLEIAAEPARKVEPAADDEREPLAA